MTMGQRAAVAWIVTCATVLLAARAADDPLYLEQWHLHNTGQGGGVPGEDINVEAAWATNRASSNEVIAIVDDGLEVGHEDLAPNVVAGLSYNYISGTADPTTGADCPADFIPCGHGTSAAGVAAARGFNGIGVSGVAPFAGLAGFNYLANQTIANQADALSRSPQVVDIYSSSWGPSDDGALGGLPSLTEAALNHGITTGRGGLGSIYLWSAGNGGTSDNSNYDGYANSRYAIAVSATTNTGHRAGYSEEGANILVNAPSSGGSLGITTTDLSGAPGYSGGNYTAGYGGTSSACPTVAGVVALMLEANPFLDWRAVRAILATTAVKNDPADADWTTNAAGFHINHKYGFGRVDARAAVDAARTWTSREEEVAAVLTDSPNLPIPDGSGFTLIAPGFGPPVIRSVFMATDLEVEFVEVRFSAADHSYWGDLQVELTSPGGTVSVLSRPHQVVADTRYDDWRFGTVRHLGERSRGAWTLTVKDGFGQDTGTLQSWSVTVYGSRPGTPATLTSPAPGSRLAATNQTFTWNAGDGVTAYWLDIGSVRGGGEIYAGYMGTSRSFTLPAVPYTSTGEIWVRLRSLISGNYQFVDHQFFAPLAVAAEVVSPAPGSTLSGPTQTFAWTAGTGVSAYWLDVGTSQGGYDIFQGYMGTSRSATVMGIPLTGGPIWVRLRSLIGGAYQVRDFQFVAVTARPAMVVSPAPGSTLAGPAQTFSWSGGAGVSYYWLNVGTSQGGYDLYSNYVGNTSAANIAGLPTDGRAVWVRLLSNIAGQWFWVDHRFTAASPGPAHILSPPTGSRLTGTTVLLEWGGGVGAGYYWINVGRTRGGYEIYSNYVGNTSAAIITGLPADGGDVWVRLFSNIGGEWQWVDHYYAAAFATPARITSPASGATLSGAAQQFAWDEGVGVTYYWLNVGTALGGYDVYSGYMGTSRAANLTGLPTDGRRLFVRLYSRLGDTWEFKDYEFTAFR